MKYIVDTSVWSLALRRKPPKHTKKPLAVKKLSMLLEHGEIIYILGIIIQEILQGIKNQNQFDKIREALSYFPMLEANREDYMFAAELFNICRSKGVQASTGDFLISAVSIRNDCRLLTIDKDFERIARHTELNLL